MSLSADVAALVLVAAALHAFWNALVKMSDDRLLIQTTIIGTGSFVCLFVLPFVAPPDRASWMFVVLSVLIHNIYFFFLLRAYGVGDLSQVYPIARGTSPLLVAILAVPLVGEPLSATNFAGVVLVTLGIWTLARAPHADGGIDRRPIAYALVTGLLISGFTLVDGVGVRLSGNALSFIVWLQVLEVVPLGLFVLFRRRSRIAPFFRKNVAHGIVGGVMATVAYALILWAYSRATLAPVAALRETSVIMAALIGAMTLGEPFGTRRVIASAVVVCGVALLNLPG